MLHENPLADAAPTRRSSRPSSTPVAASAVAPGTSRAERRRREASAVETPIDTATPIVEIAAASAAVILEAVEDVVIPQPAADAAPARRSRRDARADRAAAAVVEPEIGPESLAAPAPLPMRASVRAARADELVEPVLAPAEPFELLEPVAVAQPEAETISDEAENDVPVVDHFEAAARLFSFTGELPIVDEAPAPAPAMPAAHVVQRDTRARRRASFKRIAATSFSVGVIGVVGLLTVGMTTPAEALAAAGGSGTSTMSVVAPGDVATEADAADEIQAYVAPATTENVDVARSETYATVSMAEIARESGIKNFSNLFVNDPTSAIQWPFAVGVPMSYGFGMRSGVMHEGIDFTPGAGSPIQAIAEGTVRVASESGGAYGVHVIIDHIIDGQLVSSHYAHMQYGSIQVEVGQHVTVGTVLGRTGNTGRSFGAHTHFEILMNGTTPIDPLPWLREHAGG